MNKGKFMKSLLFGLLLLLVLTSCDNFFKTEDQLDMEERQQEIYAMYKEAKGSEALSYDEWIASIAGKDGIGIKTIDATKADGKTTITVTLDDGTKKVFTIEDGKDGTNGIDGVGINTIETLTVDGITTITINLTDGSSKSFDIISGSNGTDGNGIKLVETTEGEDATILTITLDDGTKKEIVLHHGKGGDDGVGIDTITSENVNGATTITIKLTDGTTKTFTVKDGVDGNDGTNGNGIKDITTSSTDEATKLVITLDDGKTQEIIIYNGVKGEAGKDGNDGVGIDTVISNKNGLVTTVTVTLTNGEKTSFEINDGVAGSDGLSAYELYLKYHPEYAGTEEMWIEDLVSGKLGGDYIENSTCLVTLTVYDDLGNPVGDALVEANGYKYLTTKDGKCQLLTGVNDLTYTISKAGLKTFNKTITRAEIVNAGKELFIEETLATLANTGYIVRNENAILHEIITLENDTYRYWYFNYDLNGIKIIVDVIDEYLYTNYSTVGMNDNIEFIMQKNTTADSLDPFNSLNVQITLGLNGHNWARFANDYGTYGANVYNDLIADGHLVVQKNTKTKEIDGWNGTTVMISLDYSLWDLQYSNALGNMTVLMGGRNGDIAGNSLFRFYTDHGGVWNCANTASKIESDGRIVNNYYTLPDFEEELKASSVYKEDQNLANNMAVLSASNMLVREYIVGAQIFKDRNYMVHEDGLPSALKGMSYFRNNIDDVQNITVEQAGYMIVAIPAAGNFSSVNSAYLCENDFALIARNMPSIGCSSTGGFIEEEIDYYVKWVEVGDIYEIAKWGVVLFKAQDAYEVDSWLTDAATVIKLDTEELKTKYAPTTRLWQGIPGITSVETENGTRLWASWFTGSHREPSVGNYSVYYYSDDDGDNWNPAFVVSFNYDVVDNSRVYDPSIFTDDENNLYLWWNQTNFSFGSGSVWYSKISNADCDFSEMQASTPVKTSPGLKLNKPIILSTGEWLYVSHDMRNRTACDVYSSNDKGVTWNLKGIAHVYNCTAFFEPTIAEVVDDDSENVTLMLWNRCTNSFMISVAYSYDGGATWTEPKEFIPTGNLFTGPSSRANSLAFSHNGKNYLAYAHHYNTEDRNNIAIYLSDDGGKNFAHAMILDVRHGVSYPDIHYTNGNLYVAWDYDRYGLKNVLMTKLTIEELLAIEGVEILDTKRIQYISSLTTTNMEVNISGTVLDTKGNPIENAIISVGFLTTTTDENGYYLLKDVPANLVEIIIKKAGYLAQTIVVSEFEMIDSEFNYVTNVELAINPQYVDLSGNLVDIYGVAIADAEVEVNGTIVTTNADGLFKFVNLFADEANTSFVLNISKNNYRNVSKIVNYSIFTDENEYSADIGSVKILPTGTTDLGKIGGKVINDTKSIPEYDIYLTKTDSSYVITALTKDRLTINGLDRLEIFMNVHNFSTKKRGSQTLLFQIFSSGLMRINHYPNNVSKQLAQGTNSVNYNGFTFKNTAIVSENDWNSMTFEVPYAFVQWALENEFQLEFGDSYTDFYSLEKYPVNSNTPVGICLYTGHKLNNATWHNDSWQYNDIPDLKDQNIGTEVYKNYPSDLAIITPNNAVVKNYAAYIAQPQSSFDSLAAYVESSTVYRSGKSFKDNMAELDNAMHTLKTYQAGQYLFSDREIHVVPSDGGNAAVNSLTFIYDSVTGDPVTLNIIKAGYLIVLVDDNSLTNASLANWNCLIRSHVTNHGVSAASGVVSLYVKWIEVGENVTVPANALVFTNAN